jgi:hypothetical protein
MFPVLRTVPLAEKKRGTLRVGELRESKVKTAEQETARG